MKRFDLVGTYAQLLVVARALLASSLELLAHLADLLVGLGVLCGRHCDIPTISGQRLEVNRRFGGHPRCVACCCVWWIRVRDVFW